jgi:hypothetical protein
MLRFVFALLFAAVLATESHAQVPVTCVPGPCTAEGIAQPKAEMEGDRQEYLASERRLKAQKQDVTAVRRAIRKGTPYRQVRATMQRLGWTPVTRRIEKQELCTGHPKCTYQEVENCAGTGLGMCSAIWKKGRSQAWISTIGDEPAVFDGVSLPPLVPASPLDNLPAFRQGMSYAQVRATMQRRGWSPVPRQGRCVGHGMCEFEEVEDCAGTGEGNCIAVW